MTTPPNSSFNAQASSDLIQTLLSMSSFFGDEDDYFADNISVESIFYPHSKQRKDALKRCFEALSDGADPNAFIKKENTDAPDRPFIITALSLATHNNLSTLMERLILKGANIHQRTHFSHLDNTALEITCWGDDSREEAYEVLMKHHATPTPLCLIEAVKSEHSLFMVRDLLARGMDPNVSWTGDYQDVYTPLMAACANGQTAAVRLLLSYGANPFFEMKQGQTALHFAALDSEEHTLLKVAMEQWQIKEHLETQRDQQTNPSSSSSHRQSNSSSEDPSPTQKLRL